MIRLNATAAPSGDPIDALLECHERIRRFSELGVRLATTSGVPAAEVQDAAARVHRYFSVAFPLHVLDEHELAEYLRPLADHDLYTPILTMETQHGLIEMMVAELVPRWAELAQTADEALRVSLAGPSAELAKDLEGHLALEETRVFPQARALLAPDVLATLRREQQARRA